MRPSDRLFNAGSRVRADDAGADGNRRMLLMAPLIASWPLATMTSGVHATKIDPSETKITLPDDLKFVPWSGGPPGSGEMAALYGSLDKPGPYLVLMKWHPGYMSAPHTYLTDRLSVVVSGTWWVNSGADFDAKNTVPVPAGGFVLRHAHTPHYDGVPRGEKEPAVIALFGMGPVGLELVDPTKPPWRQV
jgi:hypothetical protein